MPLTNWKMNAESRAVTGLVPANTGQKIAEARSLELPFEENSEGVFIFVLHTISIRLSVIRD
jgi:hypothetical protein